MQPLQAVQANPNQTEDAAARKAAPDPAADSPRAQKLLHSAQEFEAILVSSWWQQMQQTFSDPSEDSDPGSETMRSMGIQSMAMAMAKSGGIGLARMMYHELAPAIAQGHAEEGLK